MVEFQLCDLKWKQNLAYYYSTSLFKADLEATIVIKAVTIDQQPVKENH